MSRKTILYVLIALLIIIGLGIYIRNTNHSTDTTSGTGQTSATVAGPGEHCGGNMTTAKSCSTGYHCAAEPGSHLPFGDVGGICTKD